MINREESERILEEYIDDDNLRLHCRMVAAAMEAYASDLDLSEEDIEKWWTAGLLHDLDWEKFPDEHPNKAINDIFPKMDLSNEIIEAIKAHAPERTGKRPEAEMDKYLFACDELSGFMNAVSLVRPNGFQDMKPKSVTKKLKDKRFAENVSRADIKEGVGMINKELRDHLLFLIEVFKEKP
ncbi:MAG TPA: HD domain-containing protein [Balneolales bacterium]|nr:HD domain-containing protein [Balneolales bacterium]